MNLPAFTLPTVRRLFAAALALTSVMPVAALQAQPAAAPAAQPAAGAQELKAVVMSTSGRAQWKTADPQAAWNNAKVDDILAPGSMIRTGLDSTLALRVGENATVVIQGNSRLALPLVLKEGETLRTAVTLSQGRADFKVDQVGLTNDFTVITPSTTLAVRGTGFTVCYGGFLGTEIFGLPGNKIRAIELKYFLEKFAHYLSGDQESSDLHPDPLIAELIKSLIRFGKTGSQIDNPEMSDWSVQDFEQPIAGLPKPKNPLNNSRDTDLGGQKIDSSTEQSVRGGTDQTP